MPFKDLENRRAYNAAWRAANPEYGREWRAANPGYGRGWHAANGREYWAAYYAANKEAISGRKRDWRAANPGYSRDYYAANPEKCRARTRLRRARKLDQLGRVSLNIEELLYAAQKGACFHCSKPLLAIPHLDHLRPLAMGGLHDDANLALSCVPCNLSRGARYDAGPGPLAAL